MFLETSRLILRKFREEDFADYAVWRGDEEISRLMGNSLDVRQTFDWLKDHEERSYVLVLKETGRVIGDLTVCTVPADLAALEPLAGKRGVSLSFSISRDFRRRGLMTEALEAVETGRRVLRGGGAGVTIAPDSRLELSALAGNCWVKPLPRRRIVHVLSPEKGRLQTAGLLCPPEERPALSALLARAGVVRVTWAGDMSCGRL